MCEDRLVKWVLIRHGGILLLRLGDRLLPTSKLALDLTRPQELLKSLLWFDVDVH